jgi:hypothetical protein
LAPEQLAEYRERAAFSSANPYKADVFATGITVIKLLELKLFVLSNKFLALN